MISIYSYHSIDINRYEYILLIDRYDLIDVYE